MEYIKEEEINYFFKTSEYTNCTYVKTILHSFGISHTEMKAINFIIERSYNGDIKYASKIESVIERFNVPVKTFDTLIEAVDYIYCAFMKVRPICIRFIRIDNNRISDDYIINDKTVISKEENITNNYKEIQGLKARVDILEKTVNFLYDLHKFPK